MITTTMNTDTYGQARCTRCNFRIFMDEHTFFHSWGLPGGLSLLDPYYEQPYTCGECPDHMVLEEAVNRPYVRHFQHTLSYQIDVTVENDLFVARVPFIRSIEIKDTDFEAVCSHAISAINDYVFRHGEAMYG